METDRGRFYGYKTPTMKMSGAPQSSRQTVTSLPLMTAEQLWLSCLVPRSRHLCIFRTSASQRDPRLVITAMFSTLTVRFIYCYVSAMLGRQQCSTTVHFDTFTTSRQSRHLIIHCAHGNGYGPFTDVLLHRLGAATLNSYLAGWGVATDIRQLLDALWGYCASGHCVHELTT
jgi:hypothetical protein